MYLAWLSVVGAVFSALNIFAAECWHDRAGWFCSLLAWTIVAINAFSGQL